MGSSNWSRSTRLWVSLVCFAGLVWLISVALPLVTALMISGLVAYLLNPVIIWLVKKTKMKRALAVTLVYSAVLLILAGVPAGMGTFIYSQVKYWSTDLELAIDALEVWLKQPILIFGFDLSPRLLLENFHQAAAGILATFPGGSFNILASLTTNILWGLVVVISLYYLLKDGYRIKPWLVELAPPAYQSEFRRLVDEIDQVWGVFLRAQLLIFFILAMLMILGALLVILLYQAGLLPFSTIGLILMLVIVYTLVQQVDNLWLRPQLFGQHLRLHPGLVFIGLIGALALSGVFGALVIIPIMATVKVVGRYIRCKLIGINPYPIYEPPEIKDEAPQTEASAIE